MRAHFIAALLVLLSYDASADVSTEKSNVPGGGLFLTGPELAKLCGVKFGPDAPNTFNSGACFGYINGVAEAQMLMENICINNTTMGETRDVVVKYMVAHPAEIIRHTAFTDVFVALKPLYPCPSRAT